MKIKIGVALISFAAAGLGIAWATGQFSHDPQLEEIQQIQEKIGETFAKEPEDESQAKAAHEERRLLFEEMRQKTADLPEEKQDEARSQMQQFFFAAMKKRVDDFFELPPEDRTAELDKHIDRMERMRAEREQRRVDEQAAGPASGGDAQPPGDRSGPNRPPTGNAAPGTSSTAAGATRPPADGPGNGRPGPPGFRNMSSEEREKWRKNMLDQTSPEERAKFMEFRRLVDERRKQRGLPSGPF